MMLHKLERTWMSGCRYVQCTSEVQVKFIVYAYIQIKL